MKKGIKISLWVVGSIVGLLIVVFAAVLWLLTPAKLTKLVNEYASEYLDAKVDFQNVELSLFSNFPDVSLSITEGVVVSEAIPAMHDTLLNFSKLDISLDAWGLINMSEVSVRSFALVGAKARVLIDTSGRATWEIVRPSSDTTSTSTPLGFDISKVEISEGLSLYLRDDRDSTQLSARIGKLKFNGLVSDQIDKLQIEQFAIENIDIKALVPREGIDLRSQIPIVSANKNTQAKGYVSAIKSTTTLVYKGDTLASKLGVALDSQFDFDMSDDKKIDIKATKLTLGAIVVALDGSIAIKRDSTIASDMSVAIDALSLDEIMGYIPAKMLGELGKISTNITLEFDSHISGSYDMTNGRLPHITANILAPQGYVRYRGVKAAIDHFVLDAWATYNPDNIAQSQIKLHKLEIKGSGVDLVASGVVNDYLRDPQINVSANGNVDLTRLSLEFPSNRGMSVAGNMGLKLKCDARLSNLYLGGLARTKISGSVALDNVYVNSPLDKIEMSCRGRLSFGANKNERDSLIAKGLPVLRARLKLDTLNLDMKGTMNVRGSNFNISARTGAERYSTKDEKTAAVQPFHGEVTTKRMVVVAPDSSVLRFRGVDIQFRIDPSAANARTPHLSTTVKASRVAASSKFNRYRLVNPKFSFDATIISKEQDSTERSEATLDRLQKRYPKVDRKNLLTYRKMMRTVGFAKKDDLASGDLDLKMGDDVISLMRRWRSVGRMELDSMRVITPYMPLRMALNKVDLTFNNDSVMLRQSQVRLGRSDIELSGEIINLRRALSERGNLVLRLNVGGDTLDMNQIIIAANAGSKSLGEVEKLITQTTTEQQAQKIIAEQTAEQSADLLIIIPKNLDLKVDLDVHKAYYGEVTMNKLTGSLIARNRILQVNNLQAESSIGAINLNAVYATRSKTDITTGFDIELKQMNVKELIELIPEVDSLLPMLKSFEGFLDCKLAATASLDSNMNLLIPSLNAAGSIAGRDMVLLDGETFTDIAKIMRFKNKARNSIDKISVEMLMRNSAVELFPFILELDRYKAAVSGVQKLDMSFDYHISVLKSIIPFRLGVDIYGNVDDWKFRLTKARYKSSNVPSYTAVIDTTRIDLRHAITDIFKTGVDNLVLRETEVVPHIDSSEMYITDSLARADSLAHHKL